MAYKLIIILEYFLLLKARMIILSTFVFTDQLNGFLILIVMPYYLSKLVFLLTAMLHFKHFYDNAESNKYLSVIGSSKRV